MSGSRLWLFLGALNGLVAVTAGAYGWHAPGGLEDTMLRDAFDTGVRYHMWHALALLAVAGLAHRQEGCMIVTVAGWAFTAGIVLFSGTLYVHGLTGSTVASGLAPFGGVSFLIGWAALIWAAVRGA